MGKKLSRVLASCLCSLSIVLAGLSDAEAKRLGGGKSFGGSSSYSTPYKRSTTSTAKSPTASPSVAQQQNAQRGAELAKRGGLMGMLGGLALGGLLGALLFGGAFENLNLFDLVIFGLIAFLLYKLFARRRTAPISMQRSQHGASGAAGAATNPLAGGDPKGGVFSADPDGVSETQQAGHVQEAPPGFSAEEFLEKAKMAYRRLQEAWDSGDSSFLRDFTTASVFTELKRQLADREGENKTEILSLGAELLEVRRSDDQYEAAVLFDAFLREVDPESADNRGQQVREVWHFVQSAHAQRPTWYLDGIQQLES